MTEGVVRDPFSAGALIRAEREKQGLHIAALAAAIKVAPRKLDALENDRWTELPDATFTRALAQTVCRTLKMDPKPVLDRLPAVDAGTLDSHAGGGLNAPFNDRGGAGDGAAALVGAIRPMAWAGVLLMVAAVALYLFPPSWLPSTTLSPPRVSAASVPAVASVPAMPASVPASAASPATDLPLQPGASPMMAASAASGPLSLPPVTSNPPPAPSSAPQIMVPPSVLLATPAAASPPAAATAPAGLVQLRASANSWVEARDGRGRVLLSRLVASGEELGLDGALPIRVTIGNAQAMTLAFRGQPIDLQSRARDNVARVELQ